MSKYFKKSFYTILYNKNNVDYLVNTLSGAIAIVNCNEVEIMKSLGNSLKDPSFFYNDVFFKNLLKNGFIIESKINERMQLKYHYYMNFFQSEIMSFSFSPTLHCNFQCPYCFEEIKSLKITKKRIDTLKLFSDINLRYKKIVNIKLFGGEPLLEWDLICEYLNHITELQKLYKFELITRVVSSF